MIEPLAFPFTRDRFTHRLLERTGDVCLVERTNEVTGSVHWEVARLTVEPAKTIREHFYPAHERYPSSEEWGERGWTYTSLPEATQKYRALGQSTAQTGGSEAARPPEPAPPRRKRPAVKRGGVAR